MEKRIPLKVEFSERLELFEDPDGGWDWSWLLNEQSFKKLSVLDGTYVRVTVEEVFKEGKK